MDAPYINYVCCPIGTWIWMIWGWNLQCGRVDNLFVLRQMEQKRIARFRQLRLKCRTPMLKDAARHSSEISAISGCAKWTLLMTVAVMPFRQLISLTSYCRSLLRHESLGLDCYHAMMK